MTVEKLKNTLEYMFVRIRVYRVYVLEFLGWASEMTELHMNYVDNDVQMRSNILLSNVLII